MFRFRKSNNYITLKDVGYKAFFHLQDPATNEELSRTMGIAMCNEYYINAPNHVEIFEKTMLSGRIVKKYTSNDSYCRVRTRWRYGTTNRKGEYDGDSWTEKVEEFMMQPTHRRCPICEAIYKQVPFTTIINNRNMELQEVYTKLNNLLDLQEHRDLTTKEEAELKNLKKLRNELDPEWAKRL
jgi:hypothetical protein